MRSNDPTAIDEPQQDLVSRARYICSLARLLGILSAHLQHLSFPSARPESRLTPMAPESDFLTK